MRHISHIATGIAVMGLLLASRPLLADQVPVVSTKSPVRMLSKTQLGDIFLGKTSRFPDGSRAVPIDQSEGSPARDEFYAQIAGKSAAQMKEYWSRMIFTGRGEPPTAVDTSKAAKKLVVANPSAISYIEPKLVDDSLRVVIVTER